MVLKIHLKSRKVLIPIAILTFLTGYFITNLSTNSDDSSLFSECFLGSELPSAIVGVQKDPRTVPFGVSGYLTTGPYITLQPGKYEATVVYSAEFEGSKLSVGFVDRAADLVGIAGSEVALVAEAPGENKLSVTFETDIKLPAFEFRVFSNGKSTMEVEGLCIKQERE